MRSSYLFLFLCLSDAGQPITCFKDIEDIIALAYTPECVTSTATAHLEESGKMITRASLAPTSYEQIDGSLKRIAASAMDGQLSTTPFGAANALTAGMSSKHLRSSSLQDNVISASESIKATSDQVSNPQAPVVMLTIFRQGAIHKFCVKLGKEDGMGTRRIVHWCGAQIQVSS